MAKQRTQSLESRTRQYITLTAGTNLYNAESTALEIADAVIRTDAGDVSDQFDQRLTRISRTEYNHQAKKLLQSKPTQYYVDKGLTLKIGVWATPDSKQTYTLIYDYIKELKMQEVMQVLIQMFLLDIYHV